jgi:hypothetical protein
MTCIEVQDPRVGVPPPRRGKTAIFDDWGKVECGHQPHSYVKGSGEPCQKQSKMAALLIRRVSPPSCYGRVPRTRVVSAGPRSRSVCTGGGHIQFSPAPQPGRQPLTDRSVPCYPGQSKNRALAAPHNKPLCPSSALGVAQWPIGQTPLPAPGSRLLRGFHVYGHVQG